MKEPEEPKEKIMVEAIGIRKGIGNIKFVPIEGYHGDVAELDKDVAEHLLEGELRRHKSFRLFRRARVEKISKGNTE
jgi:hypothetical protein